MSSSSVLATPDSLTTEASTADIRWTFLQEIFSLCNEFAAGDEPIEPEIEEEDGLADKDDLTDEDEALYFIGDAAKKASIELEQQLSGFFQRPSSCLSTHGERKHLICCDRCSLSMHKLFEALTSASGSMIGAAHTMPYGLEFKKQEEGRTKFGRLICATMAFLLTEHVNTGTHPLLRGWGGQLEYQSSTRADPNAAPYLSDNIALIPRYISVNSSWELEPVLTAGWDHGNSDAADCRVCRALVMAYLSKAADVYTFVATPPGEFAPFRRLGAGLKSTIETAHPVMAAPTFDGQ